MWTFRAFLLCMIPALAIAQDYGSGVPHVGGTDFVFASAGMAASCTGHSFCEDFEAASSAGDCNAEGAGATFTENITSGATDAEGSCECQIASGCIGADNPPTVPEGVEVLQIGTSAEEASPLTNAVLDWQDAIAGGSNERTWLTFCTYLETPSTGTGTWDEFFVFKDDATIKSTYELRVTFNPYTLIPKCDVNEGAAVSLSDDTWHYVVVEYDGRAESSGGGGDVRLWVDRDPSVDAFNSDADCTFEFPLDGYDGVRLGVPIGQFDFTNTQLYFDAITLDHTQPTGLVDCSL